MQLLIIEILGLLVVSGEKCPFVRFPLWMKKNEMKSLVWDSALCSLQCYDTDSSVARKTSIL